MKKLLSILLMMAMCVSLLACVPVGPDDPDTEDPADTEEPGGENSEGTETLEKESVGDAVALVSVSINPEIELTLDEDGTVASIYGVNEDGQILLYGEADALVGVSYEDVVDYVTALAASLGYLDEQTESVSTTVSSSNEQLASQFEEAISEKLKNKAKDLGFEITVSNEYPFSMLCELRELKQAHPDDADLQALEPSEYKLALTLAEREGISVSAALSYDKDAMLGKIQSAHKTLEKHATDAYRTAKAEALRIYEGAMGVLLDGVYNEIYLQNPTAHLNTYYYGAIYQAYKTTARTYRSIVQIKNFAASVGNYEPDEATVAAIAEQLGITDTTPMENEEGKVTLESLLAFCDRFLRTNAVSDEVKAEIEQIVADAKEAAELANKGASAAYAADIAALKTKIDAIITAVSAQAELIRPMMTEAAREEYSACITDLEAVKAKLDEILAGGITDSEAEALASEAEEKAEAMLEKIRADLSEEELARVSEREAALKATAEGELQAFEERLSTAEEAAKAYIEQKRGERKNGKQ